MRGPSGEVDGPPRSANQAPRAHTILLRPGHNTTNRSRSPPTIVRRRNHLSPRPAATLRSKVPPEAN
jgi:hypothetical protein